MTVAVIDGMGGGIGCQLVERLRVHLPQLTVIALGTNAVAAQRMVEAGAERGASGENAIRVSVATADVVVGPLGIVLANALMGEITPAMAEAIVGCRARKYLLPVAQQHVTLVGTTPKPLGELLTEAVEAITKFAQTEAP